MKSWKRIAILIGVLAVAGAAVAAGAHHARGFWKDRISKRVESVLDKIQATPEQRQVAEQAENDIVNAVAAKVEARHGAHQALLQAVTADQFDAQALQAFADSRAQDVKDLAAVIIPSLQKVHDALTPAQRAQLRQLAQEHQHQHEPQGGFGGQ